MKCKWFALLPFLALGGCSSKAIDLTPGTAHGGIEFSVVPSKATYKHGDTVMIRMQVKNTTKIEVPLLIDWRDPNFGMSVSRTLKGGSTEYELRPLSREANKEEAIYLTNLSFMLLSPGVDGLIFSESIRNATPKGGKEGPLPPGEYSFVAEYVVKTPYDGTYELGGKREKLAIDEGEARDYLGKAPRGYWRAECKFTVSTEKAPAPPPRPRGGRPMGN